MTALPIDARLAEYEALRAAAEAPPEDDFDQAHVDALLAAQDDLSPEPVQRVAPPAPSGIYAPPPSWAYVDLTAPVPPIDYLIEGLDLCAGASAMSAGLGYSGKTLAWQAAAIDMALDRPVWGEFRARHGARVLHVDAEQGRVSTVRYQRLAAAAGVDLRDLSRRIALTLFPPLALDAPGAEQMLLREVEGFDLVVLDSFRALVRSVEENSSEARVPLDMLGRVSTKTGATFVVIHHARKPQKDAPGGAKATIRGSGALFDACGSILVLSAEKNQPTLVEHVKARSSGKPAPDFYLKIEDVPVGAAPAGGLRVTYKSLEQVTGRDPAKLHEANMDRVRRFLAQHPDTPGKNAIVSRLGLNRSACLAAVSELEARGEIVNLGTAKAPRLRLRGVS